MEKLAILRWRGADESPDTDELLTAADRVCRAGHWATAYVEHTGDAAAFRYGDDPEDLVTVGEFKEMQAALEAEPVSRADSDDEHH